jgi:hypothetical protein
MNENSIKGVTIAAEPKTIIEKNKPLSRSMLWRIQGNFYDEEGKNAWDSKVPYFFTSNASMARAYAHVILGYSQDCERNGLDRAQPIHIVELGAGSGRFSFLLVKKLQALKLLSPLPIPAFRYVMTDFTQKNIDCWRSHAALQPYIKEGLLDFALFDAENDSRLQLQESGIALAPETNHNPVIALANYLFDSLIQDVFRVKTGNLEHGLVTLYTTETPLPDPQKPLKLDQIKVDYDFKPVPNGYYQDPEFNKILHHYRDRLSDSAVCFPIGALRCIGSLLHLSHNRLCLLSADKGPIRERDLLDGMPPVPVQHHGCFSLSVNYHAIGRYFHNKKGTLCSHKRSQNGLLCISGFVSGEASQRYPATQFAFAEHIENFGPCEFYDSYKAVYNNKQNTPLALLSIIRLSDYDTVVFRMLNDAIINSLNDMPYELETELLQVLDRVWDNFFCMGNSLQDADQIAETYYKRHRYLKCLVVYTSIVKNYGETLAALCNIGLCLYKMSMIQQALPFLKRALEIDESNNFARIWRSRLENELKIMGPYAREIQTAAELPGFPDLPHLPPLQQAR